MLETTARATNGVLRWVAIVLLLAVACTALGTGAASLPELQGVGDALLEVAPPQLLPMPAAKDALALPAQGGLLVVDGSWRPGAEGLAAEQRATLRSWVQNGGHLVLFGHAARWVVDLELESEQPECEAFRHGYDASTNRGQARLGLAVVSGRLPELFALAQADAGEQVLMLTGGQPCTVPLCSWAIGLPRNGEVLARTAVAVDGARRPAGAPVVVLYRTGRGAVLACGLVPAVDDADPDLRRAARSFLQACAAWAGGTTTTVWSVPPRRGDLSPVAKVPATMPLLPHWGWLVAGPAAAKERSADEMLREVLLPSWQHGADLLELELTDGLGRAAEPWLRDDPLQPAPTWRAPADGAAWPRGELARMAAEAHGRGLYAFGGFDALPVGDVPAERLVALRFAARQWADVRRLGAGALDGFAVRTWFPDRSGLAVQMVQDFAPAALLQLRGERVPLLAGALRSLDAADGAPRDLPLPGVSERWRNGFPADVFPLGVLDARSFVAGAESSQLAGNDWLMTQANDFVRARAGRGAALGWRRYDPRALPPDTVAMVHGLSLEPLRAAVATALAGTGRDGLRAAAAKLLPEPPPGFGAEIDAPAAVHLLQNNRLRLLGSGGPLLWDARAVADFPPERASVLSPSFLRTRLFGGRPDGSVLPSARVDLLANGQRGEGNHAAVVRAGAPVASALPPAVLAVGETPRWPAAVVFAWQAEAGYHELDLQLRALRGSGLLTVALDDVLLHAVPFVAGQANPALAVPVHSARAGSRLLRLEVHLGGAVALDRVRLRALGEVGVEAHARAVAGCRAELIEDTHSSQHRERLELVTHADFPGVVVRMRCERATAGLQVERSFAFPGYTLVAGAAAAVAKGAWTPLAQPFVLRADDSRPDVVVVPLQLARTDRLRWRDGVLQLQQAPEAGLQARLGFYVADRGRGERWLAPAAAMLTAVDAPQRLELAANGTASVRNDLGVAWSPVVQCDSDPQTPFAVCEGGLWSWRGSQAAPDGARWLRLVLAPGETAQIVAGPSLLARTRPGVGSHGLLQLEAPEPLAATVHVRQPSRLGPPSVVFAQRFDEVTLDGEPWAWFDGTTVYLPPGVGTHRLAARDLGGVAVPHVRSTRAPLTTCRYVPERRELLLVTAGDDARPADLPFTAVLAGPVPKRVDNGEIVADPSLRHAEPAHLAQARAGGVLIRFRSGITRVIYGD